MDAIVKDIEGGKQVFTPEGKLLLTILIAEGERVRLLIVSVDGDIRFRGVVGYKKVNSHIEKAIELEKSLLSTKRWSKNF